MQALVLAAGKGTRMRSEIPKVLHDILGRPALEYVLQTLAGLGLRRPKVVLGSGAEKVRSFLEKSRARLGIAPQIVIQHKQRGTGHAVMTAARALHGAREILVWPGDMPALASGTVNKFIRCHREAGSDVSVLSALAVSPNGYGRILREGGRFFGIREEPDASEIERRIQEVNTGVYLFKEKPLFEALGKIRPANAKREYYLTDTIEILSRAGKRLEAFPLALAEEAQGINGRGELADVIRKIKNLEIQKHQERGVTFISPEQTFVAPGVRIGRDTVIYPWCYIETGVTIGRGCKIGPSAKIRGGSRIEDGAVIGSFVEIARSRIGKGVLAKHLAYLGDAVIGEKTNIGAGTITANFDGKKKHKTRIGKRVLVGSNTVFVAPVSVGDRARTGAGSVVTARSRIRQGEVVAGVPAKLLVKRVPSGKSKRKRRRVP